MGETGKREDDLDKLELDEMEPVDEKTIRILGDRESLLARLRQRATDRPVSFRFTC